MERSIPIILKLVLVTLAIAPVSACVFGKTDQALPTCASFAGAAELANQLAHQQVNTEDKTRIQYESDGFTETNEKFVFWYVGVGEFKRPGFHWIVQVDKKTCDMKFTHGK